MALIKLNVTGISPEDLLTAIGKPAEALIYNFNRDKVNEARRAYVTCHPPTIDMLKTASMLGSRDEPVTIIGPTGTGKELVAAYIHAHRFLNAERKHRKFITVNCSGITPTLFESLVFGHQRGSFTGANTDSPGYLVGAGDGVAFLDEIGDLPLEQQAKLLRVLATNKVMPVGAYNEVEIKCRFIFATHKNLADMVRRGTFRDDLYYRITPAVLRTFALTDRPDDIQLIAEAICKKNKWSECPVIPEGALAGNVRSLYNYLYRLNVLGLETTNDL